MVVIMDKSVKVIESADNYRIIFVTGDTNPLGDGYYLEVSRGNAAIAYGPFETWESVDKCAAHRARFNNTEVKWPGENK